MAGVGSDGGIRPGGGSPLPPLTPRKSPSLEKMGGISVPSLEASSSPSLAGRVTKGPVKAATPAKITNMEKLDNKELETLYEKGNFLAGYERMHRSRQQDLYEGVKDYKWVDEHNEAGSFGFVRAKASEDGVAQGILALRYLVGLGTKPSEEKFLRVIKGLNPETGSPIKGMKDISGDSLISYEYFRFLRDFQGADLLLADPPDPKTIAMVDSLESAATGGHPSALEIWSSDAGKELRSLRDEVALKLKSPG